MTIRPLTPAERTEVLRLLALEPEATAEPPAVETLTMPWPVGWVLWLGICWFVGWLFAVIWRAIVG